jgi:hypothetical protein
VIKGSCFCIADRFRKGFRRKFDERKTSLICSGYLNGRTTVALASEYEASPQAVWMLLRRNGIRQRGAKEAGALLRLPVDESKFDEPTEESLYWVGFLMADGAIVEDSRWPGSAPTVALVLGQKDHLHVEKFRDFLGSSHAITLVPTLRAVRFSVRSDRLVGALAKFGVVPRKTFSAKALLGIDRSRDFWRGVIDGDGCVSTHQKRNKRYPRMTLVGSKPLLDQFSAFVKNLVPSCRAKVCPSRNIYWFGVSDRIAQRVLSELYCNGGQFLQRKHDLAVDLVNNYGNPQD